MQKWICLNVQLTPLCNVLLSVQTTSARPVTLDWSGGGRSGVVTIQPGKAATFGVMSPGAVALSYKGKVLAQAQTLSRPCSK